MTNRLKHILLYVTFVLSLFSIFHFLDKSKERNIEHQQHILIQEAQTHFESQSNTRKWNDQYLGVYVLSEKALKPHPYLPNSTILSDDNQTLFRVNHSSMARQLSEISEKNSFKFHLTSLNPLNILNQADAFETKALRYIEENGVKEYYEFNKDNFRYLGAILTEKKCLTCHARQGYKIGDVRGGLSVTLESKNYNKSLEAIYTRSRIIKIAVFIFLALITFLIHKQLQNNQLLLSKVTQRTKQINETKELLQNVLDADLSLMLVSSGKEVILANKTTLNFLGVASLEEFKKKYTHISDVFKKVDDEEYLQTYINGEHWIDYIEKEQHNKTIKAVIEKDFEDRHLKVHSRVITVNEQQIHIIVFDDITDELETLKNLKNEATKDTLTGLFNRAKFNEVLSKEIELSRSTKKPLALIFLDIDHFKDVNDTYGHNVGDEVLVALAELLMSSVRTGDFVARWGGEEFIITLQANDAAQASVLAEKLRNKVALHNFATAGKQTISLGVTQYILGEPEELLLKRVDDALYEAKNNGRNRVVIK